MEYSIAKGNYRFARYPETTLTSLQAWNAADELALQHLAQVNNLANCIVCEDTFGVLAVHLHEHSPQVIVQTKSQAKAIALNCSGNQHPVPPLLQLNEPLLPAHCAVLKIPKSLELFEYYLQHIHTHLQDGGIVVCSFMTKYFTPAMLSVAEKYFSSVEQTKARKKARLMLLQNAKEIDRSPLVNEISLDGYPPFRQYYGVFSSGNIDYGSQFLMENIAVHPQEKCILDVASGNGVLSAYALRENPDASVSLVDDSWLAVESSKLNVNEQSAQFYWNDCLEDITEESIDLAICNPPFHFGHETNIDVSLLLFSQVYERLLPQGRFVLVFNKHLNYTVHLKKIFSKVAIVAENKRFVICECVKV